MFKLKKKNLIFYAAGILLLLSISFSPPAARNPLLFVLKTPLYLFDIIGREIKGIAFYHRNYIQNAALKNETNLLKNKINFLNEAYLENKRLRNLLSLKQHSPLKFIAARVIARPPDSWSSAIVIDKGRNHGLRLGMTVVNYLGLIGRIIETQSSSSQVLLLSSPSLSVSAQVQRSRQEGLVCGTLGSYLMMKYLPEGADIKVGDIIVTSGLSESFPKGLLIGGVEQIEREFSGLSRYALIKPAADLSSLEEVLVIIP